MRKAHGQKIADRGLYLPAFSIKVRIRLQDRATVILASTDFAPRSDIAMLQPLSLAVNFHGEPPTTVLRNVVVETR